MGPYEIQTVQLNRAQASERIAEVFNRQDDWKGVAVAEITTEIVEALGWK